jgi:hypothetical protein
MYHVIEFTQELLTDLEISRKHHLERLLLQKGTRLRVQLKPYVMETATGLVEVADLFLEDGTATRRVPFSCFSFVE